MRRRRCSTPTRPGGNPELIQRLFGQYRQTLAEDGRVLLDRYRLVDSAIKVVGIGSVGTLCMVALLLSVSDHSLFLQVKQANASVLGPMSAGAPIRITASAW